MNEENNSGKRKLQIWLIVLAAILLLSIIGNIIYMTRSGRLSSENEQLTAQKEVIESEKTMLEKAIEEKEGMIEDYKARLDSLNQRHEELMKEKDARIAYLGRRAAANANDLKEAEEKNNKLDGKLTELEKELEELTAELNDLQQQFDALTRAHEQITEKAKKAEPLNVYHLYMLNKWDRWLCADRYNVSKARRTDHTFICFEVDGTVFTKPGSREVVMLLFDPDGELMYGSADVFIMEETGSESAYTKKRTIEYDNEPLHLSFEIEHPHRLQAGTYRMEVYVEGTLKRSTEMLLD